MSNRVYYDCGYIPSFPLALPPSYSIVSVNISWLFQVSNPHFVTRVFFKDCFYFSQDLVMYRQTDRQTDKNTHTHTHSTGDSQTV